MFRIFVRAALIVTAAAVMLQPASADFLQQGEKLTGTGVSGAPQQGYAVAISADGNTAIVGGYFDAANTGAAWVYVRTNGTWKQQGSKLVGAGNFGVAFQGSSVAISGDGNTALIGGPGDNGSTGAAWVFVRSNGVWSTQSVKLVASDISGGYQGTSVALSADGNTALIGAPYDNGGKGAAAIFLRSAGTWTQQGAKRVGTGAVGNARQGNSVALSADGNVALIGGPYDDSSAGAAWIFKRNSGAWLQSGNKLVGSGAVGSPVQGYAVALSADGKTAALGGLDDNGGVGAAWIFASNGTTWLQQGGKLVGTNYPNIPDQGRSVALSGDGDTLLSGGNVDAFNTGATWVFTRSNGVWSQQGSKLVGSAASGTANQGYSAALSADGSTAIVGGYSDNGNIGAAWTFVRRPSHDFSGDTDSDILWRNTSGEAGMWLMNGGTIASTPSLGVVPNSWSIVGQRDFDGDGKSDLLWLNSVGDIGIWFMNGGSTLSLAGLGNVGTTWKVVGTGDFNGDGKADILWRSTAGDIGIWFMNGGTLLSQAALGNVGTTWSVQGTADFNGDGKADILWRNTSHDVGLWLMNGGTVLSAPPLGNVGSSWSIAGTGDFNGDGKGDILWRNTSNDVGLWLMNGGAVSSTPSLGNVGAAWNVTSVGDYNGDGKSDILWRSTSHDIGIWFMKGGTLLSTAPLGNVGPTWLVQNAASN